MHQARLYKAQEFAERAGVTVRTLHHYDRLGLLAPSGRTEAGYRLYGDRDLVRLEQILALKFIGFPLREIRRLLKRDAKDLAGALRRQRTMILEKRRLLDLAAQAIERAETAARSGEAADRAAIQKIIEVIHMQDNMEWAKKYYSEQGLASLAESASFRRGNRTGAARLGGADQRRGSCAGRRSGQPESAGLGRALAQIDCGIHRRQSRGAGRAEQAVRRSGQLAGHHEKAL